MTDPHTPTALNKALYRRFFDELLNHKRVEVIDELVAPEVLAHDPFPGQGPGADGLKKAMAAFLQAFPDLKVVAEDMLAEDDKVAARFLVSGTHCGELMGVAPTGKTISFREVGIVRIHDGKIVEHWSVADTLTMMRQLGMTS